MYDLRVDDRDFKEAPNLHTFCTSPKGLNVPLWPRQTWMTSELLNEICPTCSKYKCLTDVPKDVDADEFARNTQFLHYGVCPKCKKTRLDLLRAGKIQPYSELAGLAGQRIGKSFMAAVLMAYATHRFLKLQDPSKVYGVLPTTFMGTMVGLTFDKAVSQLWLPYKGLIDSSPWFQGYLEMLKSRELDLGKQLLKYNNQSIHFLHRGLLVHPAGPNRKTLRGNTRIFCLAEDTLIDTDKGLIQIKNCVPGQRAYVGVEHARITNLLNNGVQECVEITLASGHSVLATDSHRFLSGNGKWKRVSSLVVGDKLMISGADTWPKSVKLLLPESPKTAKDSLINLAARLKKFTIAELVDKSKIKTTIVKAWVGKWRKRGFVESTRLVASKKDGCVYNTINLEQFKQVGTTVSNRSLLKFPTRMTPELAAIIGYMVADASYKDDTHEWSFAKDAATATHFASLITKVFGFSPRYVPFVSSKNEPMAYVRFYYGELKQFLRLNGLTAQYSHEKEIPWSILQSDKECVKAFLSAYFQGDGKKSTHTAFYTTSKKLCRQLVHLLGKFGIVGKLRIRAASKNMRRLYSVYLPTFMSERFLHTIGFTLYVPKDNKYKTGVPFTGLENSAIVSIKRKAARVVYDLSIDDSKHWFSAGGLISHNCSIDEFDFFDTDEANDSVKMNGVEVYKSLTNSLFTARIGWRDAVKRGMYSLMNAYQFNISSPQSMNSPLSSIVLTNPDTKRVYAVHLATWEVHPKVSEADIRREFSDDPAKADRDFGAIPPRSSNPFLSLEIAEGMPSQTMQNAVRLQYIHGKTPSGELRRAAKITNIRKLAVEQPSVLAIDAGFSNNSFSFSVGHVEIQGKNRVVVHTALGEIMPEKGVSTLDYNKIASEVLYPIIRDLNVRFVLADRWNSLKLLHDIEAEFKIPTLVYSIKYPDFHLVKSYMEAGAVIVPKRETKRDVFKYDKYPADFIDRPVDHFCLQAATVVDTKKTISKGEKLTDDIWRALALGTVKLLDEEFCEEFLKVVKHNKFKGAIAYTGGISLTGTGLHNVSGVPKKLMGVSASNIRF